MAACGHCDRTGMLLIGPDPFTSQYARKRTRCVRKRTAAGKCYKPSHFQTVCIKTVGLFSVVIIITIIINPSTARVVGAPQMILRWYCGFSVVLWPKPMTAEHFNRLVRQSQGSSTQSCSALTVIAVHVRNAVSTFL